METYAKSSSFYQRMILYHYIFIKYIALYLIIIVLHQFFYQKDTYFYYKGKNLFNLSTFLFAMLNLSPDRK